jgi:hypothetical protein
MDELPPPPPVPPLPPGLGGGGGTEKDKAPGPGDVTGVLPQVSDPLLPRVLSCKTAFIPFILP